MKTLPLVITKQAFTEVKNIIEHKKIPVGYYLRIGIKGGGCGAAGYFLGFDKPGEKDESFEFEGIKILIDKRHMMYLFDLEVDFVERRDEKGFTFTKN